MARIVPIIVSGGQGTRLWPLSRASMPKQFIPLLSGESLFELTLDRARDPDIFHAPVIVCSQEHRFLVADTLKKKKIEGARVVSEPMGRNTAPAFTAGILAAREAAGEGAICLLLSADHYIPGAGEFVQTARAALKLAQDGKIVAFGVAPRNPHTGYGYIERGAQNGPGYAIKSFKEKPDLETARGYLQSGDYYWNAGIFMVRASDFITEVQKRAPAVLAATTRAYEAGEQDLGDLILNADEFKQAPDISFDYAVMEKTDKAAVMPCAFAWDDLGSWDALWNISPKDSAGNVLHGDALAVETANSYLRSENRLLCALGLENIVAVATEDAVLIAPRDKPEAMRALIARLKEEKRAELREGAKVYRPWGSYEVMEEQAGFKVKRIKVTPGHKLSLQKHKHRSEHWVVVRGTARVTRGEEVFDLKTNESAYIPCGAVHRLENPGREELEIVEVQTGDYLGEDDIIRLEDDYKRLTGAQSAKERSRA